MTQTAAEAALELAKVAARAADDKKAEHTLVLAVRDLVRAHEDAVREQLGRNPIRSEGMSEQQWVLLDYGDVVVHIFAEEIRMYYEIERLYRDVPKIEWAD